MKRYHILFLLTATFVSFNCFLIRQGGNQPVDEVIAVVEFEERDLDTLFVVAPPKNKVQKYNLPVYHGSYKKVNDLIHTKLAVEFDWDRQHVLGKATLLLRPYNRPIERLRLDAKGFDIHRVALIEENDTTNLFYEYNEKDLWITLNNFYSKDQSYTIFIDYTAKPAERSSGGSAAITDDRGLYFINHTGQIKGKSQQIWTQGETEGNSCWFPTIDKPNERCTQEISITVKDKFKTLSNGLLEKSIKNANGTRTDYWEMNLPHAPYLFMLAVGEFAIVKDEWKGKEVSYYVEPAYEADARAIFSNTKEMMTFYSDLLGIDFPWQKYAQIVVRDFVSGAMENTTGVIFGEFVQRTERELIDNHNESIVAHELIHHWFGDLVTCESWSNLPLNESFANYGEYLWFEHKYGKDAADYHLQNELRGYLYTSDNEMHDLIHFYYEDKEHMFDAHSYNKGGCILHYLRSYIGDEAFFAGLHLYLKNHSFNSVEAHDLRLAFEESTGEDLNWFFNQWFFETGHPSLEVTYDYDSAARKVIVSVEQLQNPKRYPAIFQLPLALDIYSKNAKERHQVFINKRKQTFEFPFPNAPQLVTLDADHVLVGTITENKTVDNYIFQYEHSPAYLDRYNAVSELARRKNRTEAIQNTLEKALDDPFWVITNYAAAKTNITPSSKNKIQELLKHPHSSVRVTSINRLKDIKDAFLFLELDESLKNKTELSYDVISAQLSALNEVAPKMALEVAKTMMDETYSQTVFTLSEIFATSGDIQYLPFFYKNMAAIDGHFASSYFELHSMLLEKASVNTIKKHTLQLYDIAQHDDESWKRYHAAKVIYHVSEYLRNNKGDKDLITQLDKNIAEIKAAEDNPRIQNLYRGW